jgi:hypothetical protein
VTIKATFSAFARCFIVAMTALMLLEPAAAARISLSNADQPPSCTACVRCECCVKESPDSSPMSAPLSLPSGQKDFQILAVFALLAPDQPARPADVPFVSPESLPATAPLYERHCAYLI